MSPRRAVAALLALCAAHVASAAPVDIQLVNYDLTKYPLAVCNDGTPGGFYIMPASQANKSHLWVVMLEGGQWCWDAESCGVRSQQNPQLTTSRIWPPHMPISGIFNSNPRRNPWAGANLVYAGYCSSDAWVGDVGNMSNSWNWDFRGQRQVEALIGMLVNGPVVVDTEVRVHFDNNTHADIFTPHTTVPLGSVPGTRLLFGGCSAGARGAMFNLDYVAAMLPAGVELRGFFDSPLWVDMLPFDDNVTSLENQTESIYTLIDPSARIPPACLAAYPGAEAWRCLYGQYRIPYVTTPYLMSASQFDLFQLPWNEGALPPYTGAALQYADQFQVAVRAVVLDLPTASQKGSAIYSSACFKHVVSTQGAFWGVKIDGMSLKDYLASWYFGSTLPATHVDMKPGAVPPELPAGLPDQRIEACVGFGCGECHSRTPSLAPPLPPAYGSTLLSPLAVSDAAERERRRKDEMYGAVVFGVGLLLAAVAAACAGQQRGGGGGSRAVAPPPVPGYKPETSPLLRPRPPPPTTGGRAPAVQLSRMGAAAGRASPMPAAGRAGGMPAAARSKSPLPKK